MFSRQGSVVKLAMQIGVPREIKEDENRVGLVPSGVEQLVAAGHQVLVETQAASGIGITDADYREAGRGPLEVTVSAAGGPSASMTISVPSAKL